MRLSPPFRKRETHRTKTCAAASTIGPMHQVDNRRLELKAALAGVLDRARDELTRFGEDVFDHAELGFREERTATLVADRLRGLGLAPQAGLGADRREGATKGRPPRSYGVRPR